MPAVYCDTPGQRWTGPPPAYILWISDTRLSMPRTATHAKKRAATKRVGGAVPEKRLFRRSKLARWGNSLGLRIPQDIAEHLGLTSGAQVSVEVRSGSLTIRAARKKWSEAELLKGVTPEAVGGEVDWGP